jgi:hypothetical protein
MTKYTVQVKRDVLIQVLEALEFDGFTPDDLTHRGYTTKAITALRAALADQPQTTHWQGCEEVHPECAIAEVERLRAFAAHPEQAEKMAYAAGWYQSMCAHCTDPRYAGVRCGVCGRSS